MAIRTAYVKKYIHVPPVNIPVSYDFTQGYSSLTRKRDFLQTLLSSMSNGLKDDWVEHCSVNAQPCGWEAIVDA